MRRGVPCVGGLDAVRGLRLGLVTFWAAAAPRRSMMRSGERDPLREYPSCPPDMDKDPRWRGPLECGTVCGTVCFWNVLLWLWRGVGGDGWL